MLSGRTQFGLFVAIVATVVGSSFILAQEEPVSPNTPGQHYRAKQVLGAKVSLNADTSVGVVDDIVLDEAGNVDYLIVMNAEKQLITVPWDATAFNLEKRLATVRIAPEQFQKIPTYTVEQYPIFSAPTYRTQVYKYYGLTPGQERRAIRRGAVVVPK